MFEMAGVFAMEIRGAGPREPILTGQIESLAAFSATGAIFQAPGQQGFYLMQGMATEVAAV
ncbi:hypothetical protein [Hydrogenophaga sp. NH-16]|uniref:hypothetical protein n=1 Tax=Hydrogenophaga sp. NH-16 TaxID=2184519 RepID=UPI000826FF11|nr:hypothetical protein [Hydrogenophaga sp. NH-16]